LVYQRSLFPLIVAHPAPCGPQCGPDFRMLLGDSEHAAEVLVDLVGILEVTHRGSLVLRRVSLPWLARRTVSHDAIARTLVIHNATRTVWVLPTNAKLVGERRCRHAS